MKLSTNKYEESKARYLTNDKKRYYLASVDENVQMLVNSQKEELTRILIEHKSEYDALTRETRHKKEEEDKLKHKIVILELMAAKSNKKMEEAETTNETMKNAIELKRKKKEEELHLKKTLAGQIDKLKTDTFLTKKEILNGENEAKRLDKRVEKAKLDKNEINERYNNVHSRITSQQQRNSFENNEQSLQIKYYSTIIDHKSMFIQSADERKERQKKIAQDAKNNSADQMEEMTRKQFEMLMLYNKYLRFKMESQLTQNANLEETYQAVRDICGTQSLEAITNVILNNERHYNYSTALVSGKEETRDSLLRDIEDLKSQLVRLKTELPVEEDVERKKTVTPIEIALIEEEEKKLIQQEEELQLELEKVEEKHRNIDLVFYKVAENVEMLCGEKAHLMTQIGEGDLKENDVVMQTTTEAHETNEVTNQVNTLDLSDGVKEENKDNNIIQEGEQVVQAQEEPKAIQEETKEVVNEPIKEDLEAEEQKKDTEDITFMPEYENIITNFNEFLELALRKFNILFLCHSKDKFLRIMQEKGIESQNSQQKTQAQLQPLSSTKKTTRISIRKRTFLKKPSYHAPVVDVRALTEPNSSLYRGELQYERDEPVQPDEKEVFKRFVDEMRRSREEYIRYGPPNK